MRRFAFAAIPTIAAVLTACDPGSFAPQDASIEVRIDGSPSDAIARVSAFVRDTAPPYNVQTKGVAVGEAVVFDHLGADFGIEVGIRELGTHRCAVLDVSRRFDSLNDSTLIVGTTSGVRDVVAFTLRCRSGAVRLDVSGLPAVDSALVSVHSPFDTLPAVRVRNGSANVHVVPHGAITIDSHLVLGSDGFVYGAAPRTVAVASGQTAPAALQFVPDAANQAALPVVIGGLPDDDPATTLRAFLRRVGPAGTRDSAQVAVGSTHTFMNVARGTAYDVGLEGLDAHDCTVRDASEPFTLAAGTVTARVTTSTGLLLESVHFTVFCRTGTLVLDVAGLPSGDSALVAIDAVFDTVNLRVGNGALPLPVVPYLQRIDPRSVLAGDGLVYDAPSLAVPVASRQTGTATIRYAAAGTCPADRPSAWYRLDGDAADATGGSAGLVQGAVAVPDRNGAANAALAFDGVDDRVTLGNRFDDLALPFSVAAWVHQPAAGRGDLRAIFVTDDLPGVYAGIWFQLDAAGRPSITYADGGPPGGASRRTLTADAPITADQWVHIAATVRGPTDMTLYVNGQAVPGTYDGSGGPLVHSEALARIGSISILPANRPWLGTLDEVVVYPCSLDPADAEYLRLRR
jgi:hypothetical protein